MTIYDMKGKQQKRVELSLKENSMVISGDEFTQSMYLVDVSTCKENGCSSVYSQKILKGLY